MSQTEKILSYIEEYGSITPVDAMREFGCMRLASRISDLKRMGYNVRKTMVNGTNRFGDTVRYAEYSMEE